MNIVTHRKRKLTTAIRDTSIIAVIWKFETDTVNLQINNNNNDNNKIIKLMLGSLSTGNNELYTLHLLIKRKFNKIIILNYNI